MASCLKCGVELNSDNWYPSLVVSKDYICKSCLKKRSHNQYVTHRSEVINRSRGWTLTHPNERKKADGNRSIKAKDEAIRHYSNGTMACVNPFGKHKEPETDIRCLTLDKIDGGHHKSGLPGGRPLYQKLKKQGWPKGWQVFCMNCQFIKRDTQKEYVKPKPKSL